MGLFYYIIPKKLEKQKVEKKQKAERKGFFPQIFLPRFLFPKPFPWPVAAIMAILLAVGVALFFCPSRTTQDFAPSVSFIGKIKTHPSHPGRIVSPLPELLEANKDLETDTFHKATLIFTEGHTVRMNHNTVLKIKRYVKSNIDKGYLIKLSRGEIWVEVIKNEEKEFWVETEAARMKSLGTKFNVKILPNKETILTTVEGKVLFVTAPGKVVVKAGYQSIAKANNPPSSPYPVDTDKATAWLREVKEEAVSLSSVITKEKSVSKEKIITLSDLEESIAPVYKEWKTRRFNHLLTLAESLREKGEEVNEDYLLNASGDTFQFAFPKELSELSSIPLIEYSYDTLLNACRAFGYGCRWIVNQDSAASLRVIEESLQRDSFIITRGSNAIDGFLLVLGYDETKSLLLVKEYKQEERYLPLPRFPWEASIQGSREVVSNPLFILGKREKEPEKKEVIIQTLKQAIRFAKQTDEKDSDYYHGLEAFRMWLESHKQKRSLEEEQAWKMNMMLFNSKAANYLKKTREMVSNYLQLAKREFSNKQGRRHLKRAAKEYAEVAILAEEIESSLLSLISQITRDIPPESSCSEVMKLWDEELKKPTVEIIEEMRNHEKSALLALEKVLELNEGR